MPSSPSPRSKSGDTSPGPDGWGWTDNYAMSVSIDPSSDVATVHQENGSQISFTPSSASACPSSYTAAAPRVTATLSCATVSGNTVYSLTRNGGLQVDAFTYNSSSQLTKITETDSNGYVTTILFAQQGSNSMGANYNTSCPSSATTCTVVSDPASRTFVLEYNSSGQLTGAVDPDGNSSGHTWSFGYDGNGNLTSITDRNGDVTSFGYDTTDTTAAFDHDMTSMTPPNGQSGGSRRRGRLGHHLRLPGPGLHPDRPAGSGDDPHLLREQPVPRRGHHHDHRPAWQRRGRHLRLRRCSRR